MYWIYAACALLVSIFQYHIIFDVERLPVHDMMPAWILPIYPVIILGPLASVILTTQPSSAGTPILIGAIAFQGLGWIFGILIYSLYITRLTGSAIPDESKRPGMYIAVGPAGRSPAQSYLFNRLTSMNSLHVQHSCRSEQSSRTYPSTGLSWHNFHSSRRCLESNWSSCWHISMAHRILVLRFVYSLGRIWRNQDEVHDELLGFGVPECCKFCI